MAPQRVIHVGIGTFGKRWCREFLRANVDDATIEVVALVDIDPASLAYGARVLGLPDSACFTVRRKRSTRCPPISALLSYRRTITRRSSTSRSRTASTC